MLVCCISRKSLCPLQGLKVLVPIKPAEVVWRFPVRSGLGPRKKHPATKNAPNAAMDRQVTIALRQEDCPLNPKPWMTERVVVD